TPQWLLLSLRRLLTPIKPTPMKPPPRAQAGKPASISSKVLARAIHG
ncbi:hypothetical protein FOMG_19966, partial [Fusarium oxysporum f. sp. melonis 26406]